MKRSIAAALLAGAAALAQPCAAQAQSSAPGSTGAKKELVQKILALQQPGIELLARQLVEQPAVQMMQAAGRALQTQVPAEKREAAGKTIEAEVKKYVEESVPIVRERAVKLAPSTIGTTMEEKFSEDELRALLAWLDSPINKKYQQQLPEMQNSFIQKLVAEARPVLDPKLQTLEQKVRTTLGVPAAPAPTAAPTTAPAPTAPSRPAAPPGRAASR